MQHGHLPVAKIERILQAEGTVSKGVLGIDISRDDIGDVTRTAGVDVHAGIRDQWHADVSAAR